MKSRRVLVVTYYFPPSGGAGVQRTLKFVKYLASFGWEPVVLTVDEGMYPNRDASLQEDVPSHVSVYRTGWWDPFEWYARLTGKADDEAVVGSLGERPPTWKERAAQWIRANLFFPDARVGWVPFAASQGRRLLRRQSFDVVLTSGPPHSVHLTGWLLHKTSGVPWVADFRDPWTDINYYHELPHTWWACRIDRALERLVLQSASAVTTVSPTWKGLLEGKTGDPARVPFRVIHNGYDADDFGELSAPPEEDHFVLTYVGSLYASRNPRTLWKVLGRLRSREALPRLRLRLVGSIDPEVERELAASGLADVAEKAGYVPHPRAVEHMQRSTMRLLVIEAFAAAEGMITGKLYEYLASGRPVLGMGPPGGDAAELLRRTGAGAMFGRDDAQALEQFVLDSYRRWEAGAPLAGADPEKTAAYSREAQTRELARLMDELVMEEKEAGS